jgi:hypothetical protein
MAQVPRIRRMSKKPTDQRWVPTAYENFLYLLHEMERVLERGQIQWPAGKARIIKDRLARIARKVGEGSD